MVKSSLEKQLEKMQKDAKQQHKKQLAAAAKKEREDKRIADKEALQLRASSIVGNQPNIGGIHIMDKNAETVLKILIELCSNKESGHVNYECESFPEPIQHSMSLELEKLVQYGMITIVNSWMSGGILNLLPAAFTYFDDKESALKNQEKSTMHINIGNLINSGNFIAGDAINSSFSVDNSIQDIEKMIEEMGDCDKDSLKEILDEVKELIENIESSRSIPKQKGLFKKISNHMTRHSWFYAEIVALLGQVMIQMLSGV